MNGLHKLIYRVGGYLAWLCALSEAVKKLQE